MELPTRAANNETLVRYRSNGEKGRGEDRGLGQVLAIIVLLLPTHFFFCCWQTLPLAVLHKCSRCCI